jgi:hypothetical protein
MNNSIDVVLLSPYTTRGRGGGVEPGQPPTKRMGMEGCPHMQLPHVLLHVELRLLIQGALPPFASTCSSHGEDRWRKRGRSGAGWDWGRDGGGDWGEMEAGVRRG